MWRWTTATRRPEPSGPAIARSRHRRVRVWAVPPQKRGEPPAEVEIDSGVASHSSGKRANFAELAHIAEKMPIPDGVLPKDRGAYRVLGRGGRPRVDTPSKT